MTLLDRLGDLLGGRADEGSLRESLQEVLEERDEEGTGLSPEARLMVMNILSLGEHRVEDIMVPRADIVGLEASLSLAAVVRLYRESGHSRLPVYRETLDDPIGYAPIEALIAWWPLEGEERQGFSLESVRRDVLFVPPSMPVLDLLLKMRSSGSQMALVVDEYGGTDGLVTIADLLEEIVGEIEYPESDRPMVERVPDGYIADARAPIEDIEELTGLSLADEELEEEIDTIGGLIASLVGRVPETGELIRHPAGFTFEVLDADPRRVKRALLRLPHRAGSHEGEVS